MGFMAGFGPAFSRSFENARDRRASREDDMFKMKYTDFIRQREKREELEKEAAARMKTATSIYGDYGDQLPRESISWIEQRLASGYGVDDIKTLIDNGSFGVSVPTVPTDPSNDVDRQMQESGLATTGAEGAPVAEPVQQAQAEEQQVVSRGAEEELSTEAGTLGSIMNNLGFKRTSSEERVNERLDEVTGGEFSQFVQSGQDLKKNLPQTQIRYIPDKKNKYMDGLNGQNLPFRMQEAIANGDLQAVEQLETVRDAYLVYERERQAYTSPLEAYIKISPDGTKETVMSNGYVWQQAGGKEVPLSELKGAYLIPARAYNSDVDDLLSKGGEAISELKNVGDMVASQATTMNQIFRVLDDNPMAGTKTAAAVRWIKDKGYELDAAWTVYKSAFRQNNLYKGLSAEDTVDQQMLTDRLSQLSNIDEGAKFIEQMKIDLVFKRLAANGQTDRAVSVTEFEKQMQVMFDSAEPGKLKEHLLRDLNSQIEQYAVKQRSLQQSAVGQRLTGPEFAHLPFNKDPRDHLKSIVTDEAGAIIDQATGIWQTGPQYSTEPTNPQVDAQAGTSRNNPIKVSTPEEAKKLAPGTWVQTPDGRVGKIPERQ